MDVVFKKREQQLEITFSSKTDLYQAHMPFIKQVGLFVPGSFLFKLGEMIKLRLNLLFVKRNICILGKVVWVMPKNACNQQKEGIGIQFDLPQDEMNDKKMATELLQLFFQKRG